MLELKNVSKRFGANVILEDASLRLPDNGFYLLTGENGKGKSTLLSLLAGVDWSFEGELCYQGVPLKGKSLDAYSEKTAALILQEPFLISGMTVMGNLLFPFKEKEEAKGLRLLKQVGLENQKNELTDSLSMGEKERLMIAIALYGEPKVLLCDEITASLDLENAKNIVDILKNLSHSILVIFATHDDVAELEIAGEPTITITDDRGLAIENERPVSEMPSRLLASKAKRIPMRQFLKASFRRNVLPAFFTAIASLILALVGVAGINLGLSAPNSGDYRQAYALANYPVLALSEEKKPRSGASGGHFASSSGFFNLADDAETSFEKVASLYSPSSDQEYELTQGHYPINERELAISELEFEAIQGKSVTIGGIPRTVQNLSDLESIDYFLQGVAVRVVGVYQTQFRNEAYWETAVKRGILDISPLLQYGTTAAFVQPNFPFEASALAVGTYYRSEDLSLADLAGEGYYLPVLSTNPAQPDAFLPVGTLLEVIPGVGYGCLGIALFCDFLWTNFLFLREKDRNAYCRLLGVPAKTLFFANLWATQGFFMASVILGMVFSYPIGMAVSSQATKTFVGYAPSLAGFSSLTVLFALLFVLLGVAFFAFRYRHFFQRDRSRVFLAEKKKE